MKTFRKCSFMFWASVVVILLMAFWRQGASTEKWKNEIGPFIEPQYVTASPEPADITQPDGTPLTVVAAGDEVINYTRTVDGYTLLQGEDGFYYFAMLDKNGDMVISSYKAKNPKKRSQEVEKFLKKITKYLEYSEKQKKDKKDKWKDKGPDKPSELAGPKFGPIDDAFPSTGNREMLVILADFSDWTFIKNNNDFNTIMNVGTNSFKAYYQDNSYGALNVTTTVVGPYTINMTMAAADANIRDFISRAVDAAEADGVNFSQFDNNSDGNMDALYVIHAGYGEEYAGAPTWYIWSHSWSLYSYARYYDGVYIDSYATSPELRNISGSTISAIGVICHEFGHNIGVPDYYDTDGSGSGGSAWDLRYWDVMASGSWNNSGDTPAQHNMYTKWKLGWSNPTTISTGATLSLGNTMDNNSAYRINTTTTNEFFILENRQQTGWDSYIPGHGMLIFHIDGNFIDSLGSNTVNADPTHQGVDIEEADDIRSSITYTGDPFPGTTNKTSFTDTTTPNSKSWVNANTNKPVTNISESGGTITFTFMGGGGPLPPPVADFSSDITFVQVGGSVQFFDQSTNSPTSWAWTFYGGTPSSSTAQNPTVTYNTLGSYAVKLTATNSAGSNTITKTNYITVTEYVYCDSMGLYFHEEYIGRVQISDLDNSSAGSSYSNYANLRANLTLNSSAKVTLTPIFPGYAYTEYWRVWIDYNTDGDFEDPGEEVFSAVGSDVVTGSIVVPPDVAPGVTMMRVSMKYGGYPSPCETFTWGEVEDYTACIKYPPRDFRVGDFNGNAVHDLLLHYSDSSWHNLVALSNGSSFSPSGDWLPNWGVATNYEVGDFNGDGKDDVVFHYKLGTWQNRVVLSNGSKFNVSTDWLPNWGTAANYVVGDFNGDGKDDLLFHYKLDTWQNRVALSNGTKFTPVGDWLPNWGAATDYLVGDFNGDGKDDVVFHYKLGTWQNQVVLSNGSKFIPAGDWLPNWGAATNYVVGDFNGDGKDDLLFHYYLDSWHNVVALSNGTKFILAGDWLPNWGAATDYVVGDFNGDGKDDLLFHYKSGPWQNRVALSTGTKFTPAGDWLPNWVPAEE